MTAPQSAPMNVQDLLATLLRPLEGLDKNQPGYQHCVGWNDALRHAMDVTRASARAPSGVDRREEVVAWRIAPDDTAFLMGAVITDEAEVADRWRKAGCIVEELALLNAPQWEPIETAPEGQPVHIYVPDNRPERRTFTAHRENSEWWICSGSIVLAKPSHWKPLDPPPSRVSSYHDKGGAA